LKLPEQTLKFAAKINALASNARPFLFVVDFAMRKPLVFEAGKIPAHICFQMPGMPEKPVKTAVPEFSFRYTPPSYAEYLVAFNKIMKETDHGNTFLLNLTFASRLDTGLSLRDIYNMSRARYKLCFDGAFTVFSPECFVRINDDIITAYPMKGTMDATVPNARAKLLGNKKELAEHHTIVDLIRNDLSMVAENVKVVRFRKIEKIKTHKGELLQMSSEISGELPRDYKNKLGNILLTLLPAGSVSGAPKRKTLEIIGNVENYARNYYTGVFGYFDGKNLDSAVMIRFVENINGNLYFKSGGGITSMSDPEKEYAELIQKIYVPFAGNHKS